MLPSHSKTRDTLAKKKKTGVFDSSRFLASIPSKIGITFEGENRMWIELNGEHRENKGNGNTGACMRHEGEYEMEIEGET